MKAVEDEKKRIHNVLILGASYGSLVSTKLLLAGHNVTLICRAATADILNKEGSIVRIPVRGRSDLVDIKSADCQGTLRASPPDQVLVESNDEQQQQGQEAAFDLVVLAMQEPQYSAADVRGLVQRIAAARIPVMAVTNMPLPPYLARIPGLSAIATGSEFRSCYADPSLWDDFLQTSDRAGLFTQCSPDPQAFRPAAEPPNVLQVRLPTNFKAARFASDQHTGMLRQLETDIQNVRYAVGDESSVVEIPVKLRVHDSVFVPLAKWAMLLAGNYRCIRPHPADMISIKEAVCANERESRKVYDWVVQVCTSLGGQPSDFVPFQKYLAAAQSLENPSSAARAVYGGAVNIERVDKVVALIGAQHGKRSEEVDAIVATVDHWLEQNDRKAKAERKNS